jgi:hypothetical protein
MRSRRIRWLLRSGAALVLLVTVSAPGATGNVGGLDVAFAQGDGQPGTSQPGEGAPQGEQRTRQPRTPGATILDLVVGGETLPSGFHESTGIDEGDDIGEGLSNQRFDPDD